MFKKSLAFFSLAVAALSMSACTDPIEVRSDKFSQYPQVHTESYYLKEWTRVQQPQAVRVGNGMLKVMIPIRNLTDSELEIDYIYSFTDARGITVEGPSSRQFVRLPRKGMGQIEFTSLTAIPADFRVQIFYAK